MNRDYDNEKTLKENIKIVEYKNWNTKKVMNENYNMRIYRKVPKTLKFKNIMINDMNQNFCGGWGLNNFPLLSDDNYLLERVLKGFKPMGVFIFDKENKYKIDTLLEKVNTEKFFTKIIKYKGHNKKYIEVIVAVKGKLKDLFDLKLLQEDYRNNNIEINLEDVGERELSYYFNEWDHQDENSKIKLWETGLILGYPIENTISIFRQ